MMIALLCSVCMRMALGKFDAPKDNVDSCIARRGELVCVDAAVTTNEWWGITREERDELYRRLFAMRDVRELRIRIAQKEREPFPVSGLTIMTNLNMVAISGTYENKLSITDLGDLAKVPVTELRLFSLDIDRPSDISRIENIRSLYTDERSVLPYASINLEYLYLCGMSFDCVCDLSRYSKLKALELNNLRCEAVKGIGMMSRLESVTLNGDFNVPFEDLQSLRNLKTLKLQGSKWKWYCDDLSIFPLESVCLMDVPIRKLKGLEKCPLVDLVIQNAPIVRIEDICAIETLENLELRDTAVTFVDNEELRTRFPKLKRFVYTNDEGEDVIVDF